MKRLAVYLKGYEKESILAPFFKFLEVIFDLIVPIVVAQIIDIGVADHNNAYIVQRFFILLLMAAVGLTCSFTAQFFAAKASAGFAARIRQALFDKIQSFSFTELDVMGTDSLVTRLTDDVNQIQTGYNMILRLVLRSPFVVLGAMIMALTINVRCAIIFAIVIPILFIVVMMIMYISIPLFKKVQGKLDDVTGLTRESLSGIRVIRAFGQEEKTVKDFQQKNEELTRLNEFVGRISTLLNPLSYVIINIATIILIHRAGIQVNIGVMKQGQVVALYNYMAQITVELIKLAALTVTLNKAFACVQRVTYVLGEESSMVYSEKNPEDVQSECAVAFQDVTFTYKTADAPSLEHIDFEVQKGETVGIIGGTGSGKSTLVNLIARFYDPSDGTVILNGNDVKEYTQDVLTKMIGVVPQKAVLFKGSIRDNLKWGNEQASDDELWAAIKTAQAEDIVRKKEGQLDFRVEQNGRNLSGGQKQRLTIARALVKKPEILILDDSASALDFATDANLRKALGNLKGKTTTFLVSQRASSIRHADQILVLDNGQIVGKGSHETLLQSCEVYQEIYYSQFPEEKPEKILNSEVVTA